MRARVTPLGAVELDGCRDAWTDLESKASTCSPYVTYEWLRAWTEVYEPSGLRLVEVEDGSGKLAAIGLIEVGRGGRWSFAGSPVSDDRGLLCRAGAEGDAWHALGDWLRQNARTWTVLDGVAGLDVDGRLPGSRAVETPVVRLDLPDAFDAYLAGRSRVTRKRMRQRMRRLEEAGAVIREVDPEARAAALHDMVRLHRERAAQKGEVHAAIDDRMARLLTIVASARGPRVRVAELVVGERRAGVHVRIDHGGSAYAYTDGVAVDRLDLSPGIVLEIDAIRDAIEHGIRCYDLGQGEYEYKRNLGARSVPRAELWATSPTLRGTAAKLTRTGRERMRSTPWLAQPVRWLRDRARDHYGIAVPVLEQIAHWSPAVPYGHVAAGG